MMENRSLDNLLGWLYEQEGNVPPHNLPPKNPPAYEGLSKDKHFNQLHPGESKSPPVYATHPPKPCSACPKPLQSPTPDPHEEFGFVVNQLYGTDTAPAHGAPAPMNGFLASYATVKDLPADSANQIMEGFGPEEAGVINGLARAFAVCDHWHASMPTQTWPNRGFVHTGSSDGHLNNDHLELYDIPTIFNVLEEHGKSWGVFSDAILWPSLTDAQLPKLWPHIDHFEKTRHFKKRCRAGLNAAAEDKLPAYSFLEPRFQPDLGWTGIKYPNDYHPPHNIRRGERFLAEVYEAVRSSPYRDKIMLVVTFDEHGGCYDHVSPPWGAAAPLPGPTTRTGGFNYDRFGVRVPAIVISSYVRPGTVFRADDGAVPYDHTSILATLRDHLGLAGNPQKPFLPSPRIAAAPTLDRVLTLTESEKNTEWPEIKSKGWVGWGDRSLFTPLSELQKGILAHGLRRAQRRTDLGEFTEKARASKSYLHALGHLVWDVAPLHRWNKLRGKPHSSKAGPVSGDGGQARRS